ncbi:tetratricopeptide repeat protein [Pseudomaricurvus alkylphenolicus]|uniref:tetratricopeptide repeat protein n=1 Tax=Pseudomaricurvus alkylphenolicus TaxID=1306991 RepID=UPI001422D1E8|nr:tetratricopeptide repeat protein [Pseudomaricurvus alkylphenolicus]NIB39827.1 tetratricopeptide repeat protein [Pseudomaricurvus alkylphenolicus]
MTEPEHTRPEEAQPPSAESPGKWDDSEFHPQEAGNWLLKHRREAGIFALLSVVLLAVVFWLPDVIEPRQLESQPSQETVSTPGEAAPSPQAPQLTESPWQDAQLAKARRQAQEILAKLLDKQNTLEGMQVQLWGDDEFNAAMSAAAEGDQAYQKREFDQAQTLYGRALDQFEALVDASKQHFEDAMAAGSEAIDNQKVTAALEAYTLATAIRPNNDKAIEGMERAQVLGQVVTALEAAENHLLQQQLQDAKTQTQAALKLDPLSQPAKQMLARIRKAITEQNYAAAMGQGYSALNNGQFDKAISQFEKAARLKPGSQATKDALIQADNRKTRTHIDREMAEASDHEGQEQWTQAVEVYQKLQELDSSLVEARIGLLRSQARASLDENLQKLLDDPLRLADPVVLKRAGQMLQDARSVQPRGPRISEQTEQLAKILRSAQDPIAVLLRSNNLTQVTVYKVGTLGNFTEHALQLKPGRYTAVGSRSGYRDVREEFTVQPGGDSLTIVIQCEEKIALGG